MNPGNNQSIIIYRSKTEQVMDEAITGAIGETLGEHIGTWLMVMLAVFAIIFLYVAYNIIRTHISIRKAHKQWGNNDS